MSSKNKVECLSEVYRRFHGIPPNAYDEIDGGLYKMFVENCEVRAEENSREDSTGLSKSAIVSCKDKCGQRARITHSSGEMKKGRFYRVSGVPNIESDGLVNIINGLEVKNLSTS